jgi:hypothetical protein
MHAAGEECEVFLSENRSTESSDTFYKNTS